MRTQQEGIIREAESKSAPGATPTGGAWSSDFEASRIKRNAFQLFLNHPVCGDVGGGGGVGVGGLEQRKGLNQ